MIKIIMAFGKPVITEIFTKDLRQELDRIADVKKCENIRSAEELNFLMKNFRAEVIITGWGSASITEQIYRENPQLKYVCHCGGSVRSIVKKEIIRNGLIITNWGTIAAKTIAEAALMGILSCLRKTIEAHYLMHQKKEWIYLTEAKTESLFEQHVGIFGFGASGRALCRLLEPFQCKISAYSPFEPDEIFAKFNVLRVHSLKSLFSMNKIISVHAAYNDENYHIINKDILALLEDGGVLVNTARGGIINEQALIEELKSGRIYASLDVYEVEPLPRNSPLRGLNNVQLIPHQAGPTADRRVDIGKEAVKNIQRYIAGEKLKYIINDEDYDFIT